LLSGNVGNNQFIVQVTKDSVLLLKDSDLVQTLKLDLENNSIVSASCCDPFLGVMTNNGQAIIISLNDGKLSVIKTKVGELPGRVFDEIIWNFYDWNVKGRMKNQENYIKEMTSEQRGLN